MSETADFLSDTSLINLPSKNALALGMAELGKLVPFFGLFNLRLWRNEGLFVDFFNEFPFNRTCDRVTGVT